MYFANCRDGRCGWLSFEGCGDTRKMVVLAAHPFISNPHEWGDREYKIIMPWSAKIMPLRCFLDQEAKRQKFAQYNQDRKDARVAEMAERRLGGRWNNASDR